MKKILSIITLFLVLVGSAFAENHNKKYEKGVEIWNNEWLVPSFTKGIPYDSIINMEIIKQVTPVITFRETRAYI